MSPASPPIKVFFIVLAAASHRIGLRSPNPPPSKENHVVYKGQFFESVVRLLALASQISVITCMLSGCAVILSLYHPTQYTPHILSSLCPISAPSLSLLSSLTPSFLSGLALMFSSCALRVWCYSTLGSLFTFEVTIKPEHKLVTSGPYGYVRHPSYTAGALMLIGAAITGFSSGSYVNQCHIMTTSARWLVYIWITCSIFTIISLWKRGRIEDERLKKAFGGNWVLYSRVVPWMFVPGLF